MRAATSLLIRWICSLVLIVAALPVKAGEAPCAAPKPVALHKADCRMPCCEGKHRAATSCEARVPNVGHGNALTKSDAPCKCEMRSAPSVPVEIPSAVVPNVHLDVLIAVLPTQLPELPRAILIAEPGIFGVDSGPPASVDRPTDRGRAPPVA